MWRCPGKSAKSSTSSSVWPSPRPNVMYGCPILNAAKSMSWNSGSHPPQPRNARHRQTHPCSNGVRNQLVPDHTHPLVPHTRAYVRITRAPIGPVPTNSSKIAKNNFVIRWIESGRERSFPPSQGAHDPVSIEESQPRARTYIRTRD